VSLEYRTAAVMCCLAGLFAVIVLSADAPEDLLLIPFGLAMALGLSGGRWLYRRLGGHLRLSRLRSACDAIPNWLVLVGGGPVLMGPVFIAGGADVGTTAAVSLLFGPAVCIALIGGFTLSFWLLAAPAWLLSRLWPGSRLSAPSLEELKDFTKEMTVGTARELRS